MIKSSKIDQHLRILVVDDAENILRTLKITLSDLGHDVLTAASVKEGVDALKSGPVDIILTDFRLGGPTGIDLIREARNIQPEAVIVVMTAYASIENAVEVTKEGAFDYLPKPFTNAQLIHMLEKVETLINLRSENASLKKQLSRPDYFVGFTSAAMQRLKQFVNQVAPTDGTVLLTGESGTGKSELARIIHSRSRRSGRAFVTVYCTTLAESVIESELFGHVKGAFTGAVSNKAGKLEMADGGTLFLDEIGDLSISAQTRLLRFLQENVIERVGGTEEIRIDARIIAATNRDLQEAVAEGKFREDLYYRLNMLECYLVPLRHRKEDIPVLIQMFLREAATRQGRTDLPVIPDGIMQRLIEYDWPGNIRELKNTLERAVILTPGKDVDPSVLPPSILAPKKIADVKQERIKTLEEYEKEHIIQVLEAEHNLEKAAEILGITPVTLWRKRKQYGLP